MALIFSVFVILSFLLVVAGVFSWKTDNYAIGAIVAVLTIVLGWSLYADGLDYPDGIENIQYNSANDMESFDVKYLTLTKENDTLVSFLGYGLPVMGAILLIYLFVTPFLQKNPNEV